MLDIQSFLSGGISGIVQTLLGHPFDTIKTMIQSKHTISHEFYYSPKKWYIGAKYPLALGIITNSIIFGINNNINNYLKDNYKISKCYRNIISGALTGMISSTFILPFENWKIQSQLNVCKKMIKQNGFIKSAFHGYNITIIRETTAMSIYFSSYEYYKTLEFNPFISGMLAGMSNWFFTYPLDTIKSRIQGYKYNTIIEAIKAGGLIKGLYIVLLRAAIVNGGIFYTYETINKNINV
jgi:solute carrier family 25 carnitine/acylcarnitine transporter 20/29